MSLETYPQAALGFRAWRVGDDGSLLAAHMNDTWEAGLAKAHCHVYTEHQPPHAGCRCGIHAYYSLERAQRERPLPDSITGVIAGRGGLACHFHGWRASEAQIIGLLARKDSAQEDKILASNYGVPLFHNPEALEAYASRYAAPVPQSLLPNRPPWWRDTERSPQRMKWGVRLFVAYVLFLVCMLIAEMSGISTTLDNALKAFIGTPLEFAALVLIGSAVATGLFDGFYRLKMRKDNAPNKAAR